MKKFLSAAVVALFVFCSANAQDMAQATESFNNAVTAYQADNFTDALAGMQKALEIAQASQEESAASLVADCKKMIPTIMLQLANKDIQASNFDQALAGLEATAAKAVEYGDQETADKAKGFVGTVLLMKGQSLVKAGNVAEAVPVLEKAAAEGPQNQAKAYKLLQNIYQSKMLAAYKGKKNDEAVEAAAKMLSYGENANAYKIGGMAAIAAKKIDQGIEWLEKATPDASVNYNLAKAYEGKGNNAKACSYYKQIVADKNYGEFAKAKVTALCK